MRRSHRAKTASPAWFKAARKHLRLSVDQIAELLEMRPDNYRRLESDREKSRSLEPGRGVVRQVEAWLDGWREPDWPVPPEIEHGPESLEMVR